MHAFPKEYFLGKLTKFRQLLKRELITDDEFGVTIGLALISTEKNSMKHCFDELNQEEIAFIDKYFEQKVRSENYMPFPSSFLAPNDDVEETKRELRPRYLAINDLIQQAKRNN